MLMTSRFNALSYALSYEQIQGASGDTSTFVKLTAVY